MAVLAAVAVRFLTPVGWMPNASGDGGPAFVICTADGARLAGGLDFPGHPADHDAGHDHCLFAGFALVGGPEPALVRAPAPRFALDAGKPVVRQALWVPRERHRPQFPRGPPRLV
jgi:hypothetical protein